MTKEDVVQMVAYCDENNVSQKQRLEELGIPAWKFYDAKRKYAPKQGNDNSGEFLQLTSGAAVRVAIVYSLVDTCKALDVDPRLWLEDVLLRIPGNEDNRAALRNLLPDRWKSN